MTGYNFSSFLKFSLDKVKPALDKEYENEKEKKKFYLALEALAEDARLADANYLNLKLLEAQEQVKSP